MFNEDKIRRVDLPRDAFQLIHDLCYDHEGRDRDDYKKRARKILMADGDSSRPLRKRIVARRSVKSDSTKERAALVRECDSLCSKLVIARDRACVRCGGAVGLMSCHILPKGNQPKLRFDLYNLMAMDYECHLGNKGWHKDPLGSREWFEQKYPGRYDKLRIMAATAAKTDLKLLAICLRREVAELEGL